MVNSHGQDRISAAQTTGDGKQKEIYIVDARRTPQAKAGLDLKDIPVPHLGTGLVRAMLDITDIPSDAIDEVIVGNTGAPPKYPNIGRVIALMSGLSKTTSGVTVHRNCASGLEALHSAHLKMLAGRGELMLAGGVESMSQMPFIFSKQLTELIVRLSRAKSISEKLRLFKSFRLPYLSPIVAIEQGLTDPFCGLNMGQTAELLAAELKISRLQQDEFANNSHQKAATANEKGIFEAEIVPLMVGKGASKLLGQDVGPRRDSSVEGLGNMRPYFDSKSGTVTVGNSCPITDGGSMLLLATEAALKKYRLEPMARIVDTHFAGLEPERMGMGPLVAMGQLLKRHQLKASQIDLFEINEAFAAQALAVLEGMKNADVAKRFGLDKNPGEIPLEKLNVNGGAIALGHPVGSSGSRITVTLTHELAKRKANYGMASLCIGGGQGGAILVENLRK